MSGLPKQVEEAANLAEELHGRMFTPESEEVNQEAAQEEPKTEPAQEENQEQEPVQAEAQPQPERKEDEETYKARYYTLKGMYDAEVPRLHKELKEFKSQVFERLGAVDKTVEPQKAEDNAIEEQLKKYREEYGDDLIQMARLIAQSEIKPLLRQTIEPVQKQVEEVSETQLKAAQENFLTYLDSKVEGDWRSFWMNHDPEFDAFLEKKDPYGLYSYKQLIDQFGQAWDADGVANIFNTFLKEKQPAADLDVPAVLEVPKKKETPPPSPAQEALVAPPRSTQHTPPAPQDKRIWTQSMIREFEKADRAGKYDEATSQAMWQDLLSAPAENRIRN